MVVYFPPPSSALGMDWDDGGAVSTKRKQYLTKRPVRCCRQPAPTALSRAPAAPEKLIGASRCQSIYKEGLPFSTCFTPPVILHQNASVRMTYWHTANQ